MTFKTNLSIVDKQMTKLFGTNGIRGIFGENFTLDFVSEITLSLRIISKRDQFLLDMMEEILVL